MSSSELVINTMSLTFYVNQYYLLNEYPIDFSTNFYYITKYIS